jgi:hypothetical protein
MLRRMVASLDLCESALIVVGVGDPLWAPTPPSKPRWGPSRTGQKDCGETRTVVQYYSVPTIPMAHSLSLFSFNRRTDV